MVGDGTGGRHPFFCPAHRPTGAMLTPAAARRHGRRARRTRSPAQRRRASDLICERVARTPWFRNARIVVGYAATAEEADVFPLLDRALDAGKQVWLPVIADDGVLSMRRWHRALTLVTNRYGIAEPRVLRPDATSVQWRERIVVCAPVVAFDAHLNRVGMGGGYYDRLFSRIGHLSSVTRLGVAFECQQVNAIDPAPWDVPLDALVTEVATWRPGPSPTTTVSRRKP